MKGFTSHHALHKQQRNFNYHLSLVRIVVETEFGCLKGGWRCLAKINYFSAASMPVAVRCVLQDVCELNKEPFLPEWNTKQPGLPEPDQVAYQGAQAHSHQAVHEGTMELLTLQTGLQYQNLRFPVQYLYEQHYHNRTPWFKLSGSNLKANV